jgi:hypothetical protein
MSVNDPLYISSLSLIDFLLQKGQSALMLAILGEHLDCVAVLIGKGTSLNHTDNVRSSPFLSHLFLIRMEAQL